MGSYIKWLSYNLVVCEFGGFESVLCDAGIHAIPIIMKALKCKPLAQYYTRKAPPNIAY